MNTPVRFFPAMWRGLACASALLLAAVSARAGDITSADQSFVRGVYQRGLGEIRMSELGQSKAASSDVKTFAERMIADHGKANAELKTLADTKGLSLSSGPDTMTLGAVKALEAKAGAEFDKAYAAQMVSSHAKSVEAFEKAGSKTRDTDLRAYITKMLPTLKEHLTLAQSLQGKVGK
jgi:putative membrane protein